MESKQKKKTNFTNKFADFVHMTIYIVIDAYAKKLLLVTYHFLFLFEVVGSNLWTTTFGI